MKNLWFILLIMIFVIGCENNYLPSPDFSYYPIEGNKSTIFEFDASSTADNESQLVAMYFRWDWTSDGIWDTDFSNSPLSSYCYKAEGTFIITLQVEDGFGGRATISDTLTITQQDSVQDPRDGQWYPITRIGKQVWMAKNLNYGIEIESNQEQTDNQTIEKYCFKWHLGQHNTCLIYGALYQWDEAMQYSINESCQGVCPPGWHIPSDSEWQILMNNFHNPRGAGAYNIKNSPFYPDTTITLDEYEAYGAGKYLMGSESSTRFNGVFSGYRNPAGEFDTKHYYFMHRISSWWSSTELKPFAYRCGIFEKLNSPERFPENKKFGLYIRCLKNEK